MDDIKTTQIQFPVSYADGTEETLTAFVFEPADTAQIDPNLPPLVFNSGFTGGVSMYGQLMGKAFAARGYRVVTYDVSGFFTNKNIRNLHKSEAGEVTNVSLSDQHDELLGLIKWTAKEFDAQPAVASWAMGAVVSLAAVNTLARQKSEQIAFYIPMSYTRLSNLQNLRADMSGADAAIRDLDDLAALPIFDTGTEESKLGYYPLDPQTQAYVDAQLGDYTTVGGVDRWPGCAAITAQSYKSYVAFDPEADIETIEGHYPPALILHGAENTLHMPSESERLHAVYPGKKGESAYLVEDMQHGQQLSQGTDVFKEIVARIDKEIRSNSLVTA